MAHTIRCKYLKFHNGHSDAVTSLLLLHFVLHLTMVCNNSSGLRVWLAAKLVWH